MEAEKKRGYWGDKLLIVLLSLIVFFNGLGLIVAGKRVKKDSWMVWGFLYIIIEWICLFRGFPIVICIVLYIVSIINTIGICPAYGRLLDEKRGNETEEELQLSDKSVVLAESVSIESEPADDGNEKGIRYDDIDINIGSASVVGESKGKLKIKIQSDNGKIFEFVTKDSYVESFKTNGKRYNYGG